MDCGLDPFWLLGSVVFDNAKALDYGRLARLLASLAQLEWRRNRVDNADRVEGWIDLHAHYTPPEILRLVEEKLGQETAVQSFGDREVLLRPGQEKRTFRPGEFGKSSSLDDRIAAMDARGTGIQVISPGGTFSFYEQPPKLAEYLSAALNDGMIEAVTANPKRLLAMVTLPLQDTETSLRELERVRQSDAVRAVRIGSSFEDRELDDRALWPFYEAVQALDMPLFLHPYVYGIAGANRMGDYYLKNLVGYPSTTTLAAGRLIFGGVLEAFPRLRILLAHGGGYLALAAGRLGRGFDSHPECREKLEARPDELLQRFYVDTIVHDDTALDYVRRVFGDEHLVCGTDYPFQIGESDPRERVESLPGGREVHDAIFRDNALRFLGMAEIAEARPTGEATTV